MAMVTATVTVTEKKAVITINMEVLQTPLSGLLIIKPTIFKDERGFFLESYHQQRFSQFVPEVFVQDNHSVSSKHVLRGLHFQKEPYAQGKLVRVVTGSCLDVALDIRKESPTFGQYFSYVLDAVNHHMIYIPTGFAHGFLTLEDNTTFLYKCTQYYHKESESCILWDDDDVAIDWGIQNPIISEKDKQGKLLKDIRLEL